MGSLGVCDEGLHALAAQCAAIASRLASQVPAAVGGPPTQATVSAVGSAYAALDSTAALLVRRIRTTGNELTTSAAQSVAARERYSVSPTQPRNAPSAIR